MDEADKRRLRINRRAIIMNIQVEDLLDDLISEEILNEDDDERIKAEKTSRDRMAALLNMLPNKGPKAFQAFCDAIMKDPAHQLLGQQLRNTVVSEKCSSEEPQFTVISPEVFQILIEEAGVLKNWKFLARALGLKEVVIAEIDNDVRKVKEQTWQMLFKWWDTNGSEATIWSLTSALKQCGLNAASVITSHHRHRHIHTLKEKLVRTF